MKSFFSIKVQLACNALYLITDVETCIIRTMGEYLKVSAILWEV